MDWMKTVSLVLALIAIISSILSSISVIAITTTPTFKLYVNFTLFYRKKKSHLLTNGYEMTSSIIYHYDRYFRLLLFDQDVF